MNNKIEKFLKPLMKKDLPDMRPGDTVRVYQKIHASAATSTGKKEKDGEKEKSQVFEGQVLAIKHGKEMGSTITVRKTISGVGVERIFPLHSPTIEKIEVVKKGRARRAKLYYLRSVKGRKGRLKRGKIGEGLMTEEKPAEEIPAEKSQ